jgi:hypothetical protein
MEPDLTIADLKRILSIRKTETIMRMLHDPARNVRWYRTTATPYGRPRVPRNELPKLRDLMYAGVKQ